MATSHTILVPVTSSPATLEALALACIVAKQRKARVFAVNVLEVVRSQPLQTENVGEARRGEQVLRRAEEVASAQGYQVTGELLQAREAGQAIIDEAQERNAEVIVLGVAPRKLVGGFELGRTVEFVLEHASCDVWLVRQGASGGSSITHATGHE